MIPLRRKSSRFQSRKLNHRKHHNVDIKIIKEFDADESGKVEFKEFVRVMAKKAENAKIMEKEEEFRKAFEVISTITVCLCPFIFCVEDV